MTVFRRLEAIASAGESIRVAVAGAGFVGKALVHQLQLTPAMVPSLLISRRPEQAIEALDAVGVDPGKALVSDDPAELEEAIGNDRYCIATEPWPIESIDSLDVVVEATGAVEHGAMVAMAAINSGKHVVSLNYETDATVGPLMAHFARRRGVVYTGSDGDQPGVMMRLIEYVRGIGLEVVVAVNCKGFLDVHATPESIEPWSKKQGTSLKMTTAFTDGTKMNVENSCVANASGLVPEKRGMLGIETTLDQAIEDFDSAMTTNGTVDFTLGGDFGSGVFVIGTGAHPELAAPYLSYLKMGPGPNYLFFRPWHLVQFETPISIAEAVLDREPTIAPQGAPITTVATIAKRDLTGGQVLDNIGGFDHYGEIETMKDGSGLLPVGLAEGARLTRDVSIDTPIELSDVELDDDAPIVRIWKAQNETFSSAVGPDLESVWEGLRP